MASAKAPRRRARRGVDDADAVRALRLMVVARVLEEELARTYAEGKLEGWIHSCEGHEALGAAVAICLGDGDHLVPHYRSRPEQLGKGMTVREVVAELVGSVHAASGGRGGETHVSSVSRRIYGMTGVLGANIATAAGVALASKLRRAGEVTLCTFGDGTANRGTFHEALNLAAVWELPVVFVCENNVYAEMAKSSDFMRVRSIADRARGYGMPGRVVDGHDAEALIKSLRDAVAQARGGRPSLIEAQMVRRRGHWEGDPQQYRSNEEMSSLADVDPVVVYRKRVVEERQIDDAEVSGWEQQARKEVRDAIVWALESPRLGREAALGGVYAERDGDG